MPPNVVHGGRLRVVRVCTHDGDASFAFGDQANDGSK